MQKSIQVSVLFSESREVDHTNRNFSLIGQVKGPHRGLPHGGRLHPVKAEQLDGSFYMKPLRFWTRVILGLIFIMASADKILHPKAFAEAIFNYQILPDSLINLMAIMLPWLEILLGLFLIGGFWLPGVVSLANALLVVFFGALVFNVARGLDVHCGCFSTGTKGEPATAWYLARDSAFLLMGGYLFFKEVIGAEHGTREEHRA
jgi:uncharacterized membrane protein YphA (DoxX/SURF4 family)